VALFYETQCPGCQQTDSERCADTFTKVVQPPGDFGLYLDREKLTACPACLTIKKQDQYEVCFGCNSRGREGENHISSFHSLGLYNDHFLAVKKAWKQGREWPINPLAASLASWLKQAKPEVDTLTWVPMLAGSRGQGLDPLREIVVRACQRLKGSAAPYKCAVGLTTRVHDDVDERDLKAMNEKERAAAVHRRYRLTNASGVVKAISGRRFLLVDDVFTTGATANRVAGLLRAAGAADVQYFNFARTVHKQHRSILEKMILPSTCPHFLRARV